MPNINVEVPSGLKNRIEEYLKKENAQYATITQLVITSIAKELDRLEKQ